MCIPQHFNSITVSLVCYAIFFRHLCVKFSHFSSHLFTWRYTIYRIFLLLIRLHFQNIFFIYFFTLVNELFIYFNTLLYPCVIPKCAFSPRLHFKFFIILNILLEKFSLVIFFRQRQKVFSNHSDARMI